MRARMKSDLWSMLTSLALFLLGLGALLATFEPNLRWRPQWLGNGWKIPVFIAGGILSFRFALREFLRLAKDTYMTRPAGTRPRPVSRRRWPFLLKEQERKADRFLEVASEERRQKLNSRRRP
jgi:hypothetical protein